jgi:hypothetical protein
MPEQLPVPPEVVAVGVGVAVRVAVAVAVDDEVAVAVARVVAVARAVVAVGVDVRVAVAVVRPEVAVAVGVRVAVAVGVESPLHVPLFVHQLSVDGLNGEFGGQSRVAWMAVTEVYLLLLYTTEAPLAYAVQLANAGRPKQVTCADAGAPANRTNDNTPPSPTKARALMDPPEGYTRPTR